MSPVTIPARREPRLQHVPPPPGGRPHFEILDEVACGRLALALWEGLHDVLLWAATEPEVRPGLFAPSAGSRWLAPEALTCADPEVARALVGIRAVASGPSEVAPEPLAEACCRLYAWAEERALLQTAAHFAEAAALVKPDAPGLANLAARACRRAVLLSRAGLWYQRGKVLALRLGLFEERFRAALGYGWLMYSLGRLDHARRTIQSAARRAVHTGHRRLAAEADHDLILITAEAGQHSLSEAHARKALRHYPIHHPRIPFLVHDIAYAFVLASLYADALPLLSASIAAMPRPQDPVLAWSTTARAAAGANLPDVYLKARDNALALIAPYPEHAPATLYNVAYAAGLVQDWDTAERVAEEGLKAARHRGARDMERNCCELLACVRERRPWGRDARPPATTHVPEITRVSLLRLRQWAGPKRGRPPGRTPPA